MFSLRSVLSLSLSHSLGLSLVGVIAALPLNVVTLFLIPTRRDRPLTVFSYLQCKRNSRRSEGNINKFIYIYLFHYCSKTIVCLPLLNGNVPLVESKWKQNSSCHNNTNNSNNHLLFTATVSVKKWLTADRRSDRCRLDSRRYLYLYKYTYILLLFVRSTKVGT